MQGGGPTPHSPQVLAQACKMGLPLIRTFGEQYLEYLVQYQNSSSHSLAGARAGVDVGDCVGSGTVGKTVGDCVGCGIVGETVGDCVGSGTVGEAVGDCVGSGTVGEAEVEGVGSLPQVSARTVNCELWYTA